MDQTKEGRFRLLIVWITVGDSQFAVIMDDNIYVWLWGYTFNNELNNNQQKNNNNK